MSQSPDRVHSLEIGRHLVIQNEIQVEILAPIQRVEGMAVVQRVGDIRLKTHQEYSRQDTHPHCQPNASAKQGFFSWLHQVTRRDIARSSRVYAVPGELDVQRDDNYRCQGEQVTGVCTLQAKQQEQSQQDEQ